MKTCVKCRSELPESAVHCVFCGAKQPQAVARADLGKTKMGYAGLASEVLEQAKAAQASQAPAAPGKQPGHAPMSVAPTEKTPMLPRLDGPSEGSQPAFSVRPDNLPDNSSQTPPPARRMGPHSGPGVGPYQPPPLASPSVPASGNVVSAPPNARTMAMPPGEVAAARDLIAPPPADRSGPVSSADRSGPSAVAGGFTGGAAYAPTPHRGGPALPYPSPTETSGFGPPPGMGGMGGQVPQIPGPPPGMGGNLATAPRHAGAHRPPYLASETDDRANAPVEPWAHSIKTLMLVFGVLLIACFVAPWSVAGGKTVFSWSLLKGGALLPKLPPLLMVATGLLAIVFALTPMGVVGRGVAAMCLGVIAAVGVPVFAFVKAATGGAFDAMSLVALSLSVLAFVTLVPGLLVRAQYRSAMLPRILVTLGVLATLAPFLIPVGGALPIVGMLKGFSAGGSAIVVTSVTLLPVLLSVLAQLCWLPAPSSGLGHVLAWLFVFSPLIVAAASLVVLGGGAVDALKANLSATVYVPLATTAWISFAGFGLATLFGKKLEPR